MIQDTLIYWMAVRVREKQSYVETGLAMGSNRLNLGIDIGSVSVKLVLLNDSHTVIEKSYTRHFGEPFLVLKKRVEALLRDYPAWNIARPSFTGTGGKLASQLLGGSFVNEVIAQSEAVITLYPHVRTIIEMGGEDSKLITLEKSGGSSSTVLNDFALNTMCSAGTGSFLDQQASRLGICIESEFGNMALRSATPPHIAGRCSVFAKSDMIHLQQIGTPVHDIVAGLCFALARSFKSSLVMGRKIDKPLLFQGGVAANKGLVMAFESLFGLESGELIIPENFTCMGAIGAVISSMRSPKEDYDACSFPGFQRLDKYLGRAGSDFVKTLPLRHEDNGHRADITVRQLKPGSGKEEAFLGIDIGSLSTNVVVIDRKKNLLARSYLRTAGNPLHAVRQALLHVGARISDQTLIMGVGITGSGRYMVGEYVGADIVKNEITAQSVAAIHFYPDVDTVFEIGGQDSKYISIRNGVVVDFEMNKVCAAGTGSFIEEQAEKLGLDIKDQFSEYAFNSRNPGKFGDRCTVFIESDLVSCQQKGADKEDIVSGLAYSIVHNYLNRVVGRRKIGKNILFQGGVAWNSAIVAAFSRVTGKKITVPPHHDVTGALGAAILAKKESEESGVQTAFKGFDLRGRRYQTKNFECRSCANVCNISRVSFGDDSAHVHGARCDKYETVKKVCGPALPDLFLERERLLFGAEPEKRVGDSLLVGIPRVLFMHQHYPFWKTFLREIGVTFILSEWTCKSIITTSSDKQAAETCLPAKIVQGHLMDLISRKVTHILFPSVITLEGGRHEVENNYSCPLVQTAPELARAALYDDLTKNSIELVSPEVHLQSGSYKRFTRELMSTGRRFNAARRDILLAIQKAFNAQSSYEEAALKRGLEIISLVEQKKLRGVAIISRPYNGCDRGMNFNLPQKLKEMGVVAIPLDFLPYDRNSPVPHSNMYWKSGQDFLRAAEFLRGKKYLPAIHLSSFKCGPDSFTSHFLRRSLNDHPLLELELDEHNADAGFITRCEAFFDSLARYQNH